MQEFYNIQKFKAGGRSLTPKMTRDVVELAEDLKKAVPKLAPVINKLITTKKPGKFLTKEENEIVQKALLTYKAKSGVAAQNTIVRKKVEPVTSTSIKSMDRSKPSTGKQAVRTEPSNRTKSTKNPTTNNATNSEAQAVTLKGQQLTVSESERATGIVGSTLKGRYNKAKQWVNTHPNTVLAGGFIGLGTGPGRYILSKTFGALQKSPEDYFNDSPAENKNVKYININGVNYPVSTGEDGNMTLSVPDTSVIAAPNPSVPQNVLPIQNSLAIDPNSYPTKEQIDSLFIDYPYDNYDQ